MSLPAAEGTSYRKKKIKKSKNQKIKKSKNQREKETKSKLSDKTYQKRAKKKREREKLKDTKGWMKAQVMFKKERMKEKHLAQKVCISLS